MIIYLDGHTDVVEVKLSDSGVPPSNGKVLSVDHSTIHLSFDLDQGEIKGRIDVDVDRFDGKFDLSFTPIDETGKEESPSTDSGECFVQHPLF